LNSEKKNMHALNSSASNLRKQEGAFISDVLYGYSSSGKSAAGSKLSKLGNSAKTGLYITQQAVLPFSMLLFKALSKQQQKCKDSWNG